MARLSLNQHNFDRATAISQSLSLYASVPLSEDIFYLVCRRLSTSTYRWRCINGDGWFASSQRFVPWEGATRVDRCHPASAETGPDPGGVLEERCGGGSGFAPAGSRRRRGQAAVCLPYASTLPPTRGEPERPPAIGSPQTILVGVLSKTNSTLIHQTIYFVYIL